MAAVVDELAPTITALGLAPQEHAHSGRIGNTRIAALVCGIGADRAVTALDRIVEVHGTARVIHLGFAGGLDPTLPAGAVPPIRLVMDESGLAWCLDGDRPTSVADHDAYPTNQKLITINHITGSVAAKRRLFEQHRACAVDMETFAVARRAAQLDVRLTVLRAISDTAHTALPRAASQWVTPDGSRDTMAVTRHLALHPWQLQDILRLRRNARLAAQALADRVEEIVGRGHDAMTL